MDQWGFSLYSFFKNELYVISRIQDLSLQWRIYGGGGGVLGGLNPPPLETAKVKIKNLDVHRKTPS